MEELWKKFKEETKDDMLKINEFLRSLNEKNEKSTAEKLDEKSLAEEQISKNTILDEKNLISDDKIKNLSNEKSQIISRKEIYGKLKEIVKELMEKENLSRAQAYRRAKRRLLSE